MYPVSEAFLRAVQENTRNYYWTGQITTKGGAVYPFVYEDIVKGSGYITAQCCGSAEIELGTVYAAEMGITLFSQIDRYTLEGAEVRLSYHLRLADCSFEEVPMGVFEVSEATNYIKSWPEWEFVGAYTDEGISVSKNRIYCRKVILFEI